MHIALFVLFLSINYHHTTPEFDGICMNEDINTFQEIISAEH
jgi:hypothetical protein